tara:strand:+ start:69 stop:266 length:198 start_codon:yes stop_codon:yes gene_type:complete
MSKLEDVIMDETIALVKCAEKIAEMNETLAGMIASMQPEIENKLQDSTSILSQVLQSLQDRKEGR